MRPPNEAVARRPRWSPKGATLRASSCKRLSHVPRRTSWDAARRGVSGDALGDALGAPEGDAAEGEDTSWLFLVVFVASVSVYVNGLSGDLVHDDIPTIRSNPDVLGATPLGQVFRNDYWGRPMSDPRSHKSYRPLTILTFRWVLGGRGGGGGREGKERMEGEEAGEGGGRDSGSGG